MKKNKDITRSIRIDGDLLKEAKRQGVNINGLVSIALEDLLKGSSKCPVCNNHLKKKGSSS